jgi:alpha-tubulin suppressor-like RCC1 family protein
MNNIYTFGSSRKGQLGHGELKTELYPKKIKKFTSSSTPLSTPTKQKGGGGASNTSNSSNNKIVQICCGFQSTVVLFQNSEIYAWGDGIS